MIMGEPKVLDDADKKAVQQNDVERGSHDALNEDDTSSLGRGDILSREHTDPVLNAKMHLINNVSARHQRSKGRRISSKMSCVLMDDKADLTCRRLMRLDSPHINGKITIIIPHFNH